MSEQQEVVRKNTEMEWQMEKMKKPYILAKRYDWEGFGNFFHTNKDLLDKNIDFHGSTALHYAAHCGSPEMYKEMLEWVDKDDINRVLRLQDDMGNTPLHEVAFTGEVEMTKSILEYEEEPGSHQYEKLIEMRNYLGETPVYRAAALGKTELLSFFLQELRVDPKPLHFHRLGDNMSIVDAAVSDRFFGTALWILKRYEYLAYEKEYNEMTTLQLLAKMPSTFKSQTQMGPLENSIYLMLPDFHDYKYYLEWTVKKGDLESGGNKRNEPKGHENGRKELAMIIQNGLTAFSWMRYFMWKVLAKGRKEIDELWRNKEMHSSAKELVYLLAQRDYSWRNTAIARDRTVSTGSSQHQGKPTHIPLLMAACNGITEIVELIIHFHPHSVEYVSDDGQNILHMAVKHRQKKIYQILKKSNMLRSLAGKIDEENNTVLHYTAEFQGGSQPGYAIQLQEELHWFDRIEKRLPFNYTFHKNKLNKTAKELFVEKHEPLLKDAREWMKETAQSCSAVAVLVATVVFTGAYTVPGGTDNDGFPRFLHHPIFLMFMTMDVLALVGSLASVSMFLSILTSPCEMRDFRKALPRKLKTGFALFFFSMATTMLAFSATILINIKLEKNKWSSSLAYYSASFPVCMFVLLQFPLRKLYVAIKECTGIEFILRKLKKKSTFWELKKMVKKIKRERLWEN